ncbi:hypothetical protein SDRG_05494 [Saprolegnia diclina VS20]|uniref:Uncharacterized protein n=1 Tax=Saprolegnia diclina (strain VS20) TaxID=1156394 RepID=T0QTC8_SAPDV|nr:hypothetical protein SDRG_05494 [Saprolegnia diclina VS20]EQC37270.1 hypothetical protein SDRG_05494 [Saprolegnia diclina VS20]|eukprot:XP_008609432.1 hypothetical protein SDRG_05494 [Saprolegnia diclina VS20]
MVGSEATRNNGTVLRPRHDLSARRRFLLGPLELLSASRWLPITLVYASVIATDDLQEAIRTALDAFPIFAGRLQWHTGKDHRAVRLAVELDNDQCGIPFHTQVSELHLDAVALSPTATMWQVRRPLSKLFANPTHATSVRAMVQQSTPLVFITVTHLADHSGSVLSIEFAHCLGDAASFYHFLSLVADAAQHVRRPDSVIDWSGPYTHLHARLSRVTPSTSWLFVTPHASRPAARAPGDLCVQGLVFWLSPDEINALKASANFPRASTNDVVSAFCWQLVASQDATKATYLRVLVNVRSVFRPPLPATTIGNMIYAVHVPPPSKNDVAALASACRLAIESAKESAVSDIAAVYEKAASWSKLYWHAPEAADVVVSTTNLSRYNFTQLQMPTQGGFASAVDQLETANGGFLHFFQVFADARGGVRVVAHVAPAHVAACTAELTALRHRLASHIPSHGQ